jgi:predicted outer membrane repeat protein
MGLIKLISTFWDSPHKKVVPIPNQATIMNLFLSTFTPKVLKATGILLLFYTSLCAQNRYYVNPSANGSGNGQSWADAFTDLHQALSIAEAGDAVWVAKGDFRPDTATNRDRSFVLKSGIKFYGGFVGTETDLKQRDIAANPSLLNGNIGDPADSTDNSYTILYLPYPDTSTLVDGFTLQHGHANSDTNFISTSPVRSGGGVYVMAQGGKGMPTFSNCVFRDNYAKNFGGAYYVQAQGSSGSTPIFQNCTFFNNRAGGSGGAVHLSGGNGYDRGIEMDHCVFDMNQAYYDGGSIYWANAFGPENINFLGCTITRSKSTGFGPLIYAWRTGTNTVRIQFDSCHILQNYCDDVQNVTYGAIEIVGNDNERKGVIRVENSSFENNDLTSGIFYILSSNDFSSTNPDSVFFLNNTFLKNKAAGSSIRLHAPLLYAKIEGNVFAQNEQWDTIYPQEDIWIWGANMDISKNIFYNNRSRSNVYIGLLARPNSYALIDNNVFSGNNRPLALTVRKFGMVKHDTAYVTNNVFVNNVTDNPVYNFMHPTYNVFTNNVFWGNKNSVTGLTILPFPMLKDTFYFVHNLFDASSYCTDYPHVTCGPNNLYNLDPLFRDTANHDYSLLPCSPLLNKGSNAAAGYPNRHQRKPAHPGGHRGYRGLRVPGLCPGRSARGFARLCQRFQRQHLGQPRVWLRTL